MSVLMEQRGFSRNLIFEYFLENMSRKFNFHEHLKRITSTLHEDHKTSLVVSWPESLTNNYEVPGSIPGSTVKGRIPAVTMVWVG